MPLFIFAFAIHQLVKIVISCVYLCISSSNSIPISESCSFFFLVYTSESFVFICKLRIQFTFNFSFVFCFFFAYICSFYNRQPSYDCLLSFRLLFPRYLNANFVVNFFPSVFYTSSDFFLKLYEEKNWCIL